MYDVKVVHSGPCININGVDYIHHLNGGGLKSTTSIVDESVYLGPFVVVRDKAEIIGKGIKISGKVEISSKVKIHGDEISIFGYGHLCISNNINKTNIDIYGCKKWEEAI